MVEIGLEPGDLVVRQLDVEGSGVDVDDDDLESTIESLIHMWDDGFTDAVDQHFEEATALQLKSDYATAFSPRYQRAFSPRVAAADLEQIGELT